jgi:hypothetical protein
VGVLVIKFIAQLGDRTRYKRLNVCNEGLKSDGGDDDGMAKVLIVLHKDVGGWVVDGELYVKFGLIGLDVHVRDGDNYNVIGKTDLEMIRSIRHNL